MEELWKRPLFTDGFNSLAHFVFGALSTRLILIGVIFTFYQLQNKENFLVDMGEWLVGYIFAYALST
jgi:hypothetical protein